MGRWMQARKKPMIVEFREVEMWGEQVDTGHGKAYAFPDEDFIIRDEVGEYPIKKTIFRETYDVLETPLEYYKRMKGEENVE